MGLDDKRLCAGPSGCGHPRHEHTGNHQKGTRTACRHRLAHGRGVCACTGFKGESVESADSRTEKEGAHG
jgi:hypothetical protein